VASARFGIIKSNGLAKVSMIPDAKTYVLAKRRYITYHIGNQNYLQDAPQII